MEVVILRSPLVYGPGVGANFLNLLKIVNKGFPLPFLNVKNRRSIIYVENLVSFIATCLSNKSAVNQKFLISDSKPVSTPDLIKLLERFFEKDSRLFKFPVTLILIIGFISRTNNKLDKLLNSLEIDPSNTFKIMKWEPPFTIEEGLRKTVNWFKKQN